MKPKKLKRLEEMFLRYWEFLAYLEKYTEEAKNLALHPSDPGRTRLLKIFIERMRPVLDADIAFIAYHDINEAPNEWVFIDGNTIVSIYSRTQRSSLRRHFENIGWKLPLADLLQVVSGDMPSIILDPTRIPASMQDLVTALVISRINLVGREYFLFFCDFTDHPGNMPRYDGFHKKMLKVAVGILQTGFLSGVRTGRQEQLDVEEVKARQFLSSLQNQVKNPLEELIMQSKKLETLIPENLYDLRERTQRIQRNAESLDQTFNQVRMLPDLRSDFSDEPSDEENFEDFELNINEQGYAFARSAEGETSPVVINNDMLNTFNLTMDLINTRKTNPTLLEHFGEDLYSLLFPDEINAHLLKTEAVARSKKTGMRLRLKIDHKALAKLPLEFLYRKKLGYFFAVNPGTVLSRYIDEPIPVQRIQSDSKPLHLLAIIANPNDQEQLDPEVWEKLLDEALQKPKEHNQVTVKVINRATRKEIRNALHEQKPDIIQFIGRSIFKNDRECLALVNENDNKTWALNDEQFANLFLGADDHIRLVSLVTCESEKGVSTQGFLSIAHQIMKRGALAVVTMQYSVQIKSAEIFLEDFYIALAKRKPLDWAVQSARNAISFEMGLGNREFATPVLYMRSKDGKIF